MMVMMVMMMMIMIMIMIMMMISRCGCAWVVVTAAVVDLLRLPFGAPAIQLHVQSCHTCGRVLTSCSYSPATSLR